MRKFYNISFKKVKKVLLYPRKYNSLLITTISKDNKRKEDF